MRGLPRSEKYEGYEKSNEQKGREARRSSDHSCLSDLGNYPSKPFVDGSSVPVTLIA